MALVPDQKFSTFQVGGDLEVGDIIVGLRGGINTQFTWEIPASVTTVTGTANEILVNGTSGSPIGGDVTLTIAPTFPGQTSITTLGTIGTGTWEASVIGILYGGTGVSAVTTAPGATAWAGWDANKNLSANNFIPGFTTTVSSGTPIVLTVASTEQQYITGSTNQTVTMPVTSTLVTGMQWTIVNISSATITIQSSGANSIVSLPPASQATVTCILNSGTTAASWADDFSQSSAGVSSITGTANQVIASAATGAVTLSLPQNINTAATPIFAGFNDSNNNAVLRFGTVASAVNYMEIVNNSTGQPPSIQLQGSDPNISGYFVGKGDAGWVFQTAAVGQTPFTIQSGTTGQHTTHFQFLNSSATDNYTFPDYSGVVQVDGYTTTATAASTTTLTNQSTYYQFFTGSTTQTITMPVTSTLVQGQTWRIVNNSTGIFTVNSSGGNLIGNVAANTIQDVVCILTSGTTAASWYMSPFYINFVRVQTFPSSGTYTPTPGMVYCVVEMVGGGGGGGGTPTATSSSGCAGGAGGSGAYSKGLFSATTIGTSQTVTVGAGGSAGANANGGSGGTSSLGSLITAPGGGGGAVNITRTSSAVFTGSAAAIAGTGGSINAPGTAGTMGVLLIGSNVLSGNGGSTLWGGGGIGVTGTNNGGTSAAANSGGGGSGSIVFGVTGVNAAGGSGGTGLVIITEYIG